MIIRHQTPEHPVRKEQIEESLELVKRAIAVDTSDGSTWAVLGNTYLSLFFNVSLSPDILRKAMSAYTKAEKDPKMKYQPDLFYNQAVAMKYEEDYEKCLDRLEKARRLEPDWRAPKATQESLIAYLDTVDNFVRTRGKTKEKKLGQMLKMLKEKNTLGPYSDGMFKTPGGAEATLVKTPISLLKRGDNREKVVSGVVVCSVNTQDYVPL